MFSIRSIHTLRSISSINIDKVTMTEPFTNHMMLLEIPEKFSIVRNLHDSHIWFNFSENGVVIKNKKRFILRVVKEEHFKRNNPC